jgi:hypothetical protein
LRPPENECLPSPETAWRSGSALRHIAAASAHLPRCSGLSAGPSNQPRWTEEIGHTPDVVRHACGRTPGMVSP